MKLNEWMENLHRKATKLSYRLRAKLQRQSLECCLLGILILRFVLDVITWPFLSPEQKSEIDPWESLLKQLELDEQEEESHSSFFEKPRVPLWFVGIRAGLAALVLLNIFFFGSYSGLGSSL